MIVVGGSFIVRGVAPTGAAATANGTSNVPLSSRRIGAAGGAGWRAGRDAAPKRDGSGGEGDE